jgi:transcriptional regulator with XRE-family HTH domain
LGLGVAVHAPFIRGANLHVNSAAHGFRQAVSISVPDMESRKAKPTPADEAAAAKLRGAWATRGRKPSQSKMGEALGITQGAVSQYLNGKIPMNYYTLVGFCGLLDIADPKTIRDDLPEQAMLTRGIDLDQKTPDTKPQHASQAVELDPDMVAETHQALRLYYRRRGKEYDIERQPEEFIWAYGLRLDLGDEPSSADLIDFGAKLAERIRKRAEAGRGDQQNEGSKVAGGDRR